MGIIRVGMVGAGWIAREHRRVLDSVAEAELAAVCDLDLERAGELAAGTGARVYQDWRDLLGREDLGALLVCTPPRSHAGPAVAALNAGLPVYLEKPIARTPQDAAPIVAAAERSGTVCAVGYQWHALDLFGDLPGLLQGQQIGVLVGTCIGPTQSRPWFLAAGLKPFVWNKRPSVNYYRAPPEALESPEAALSWAREALGAALRARKKKS